MWKNVYYKRYETQCEVNEEGEVRNKYTHKTLKGTPDGYGYLMVNLFCRKNGEYIKLHRMKKIHIIVAENFLPKPKSNVPLEIDHIDGNKNNNAVSNLEWVTHQENIKRAQKLGLVPHHQVGVDHFRTTNTEEEIHNVCKLLSQGVQHDRISELTGVRLGVIRSISVGKTWKHISKDYTFPKKPNNRKYYKVICDLLLEGFMDKEILEFCPPELTRDQFRYVIKYVRSTVCKELGIKKKLPNNRNKRRTILRLHLINARKAISECSENNS